MGSDGLSGLLLYLTGKWCSMNRRRIAMVYECDDTTKVRELFAGWKETLIYSCLQQVMGKIYVTDLDHPKSAFAFVGCFEV